MGIFRRRGRPESPGPGPQRPDAPADELFPDLSVDDVAWIRSTAQGILAGHGIEVTPSGADLVAADGMRFALDNAVTKCRTAPRSEWTAILGHHFGAMARMQDGPTIDDLTPEQFSAQVRTRLIARDALVMGGVDMRGYARTVADDLAAVLCVDFPETVGYIDGGRAERLDLDAAFRSGQQHTDAEPIDEVRHTDSHITFVFGQSVFTASKVLNMAGLATQVFGRDAPYGVVFAVPDRTCVLMHLIESSAVMEAIGQLAQAAAGLYHDAISPVSPNIYHWYRDRITRVSSADAENRSIDITPDDHLMNILEHLNEANGNQ
ncbi:hypothetical protein [Gordonia sp. NB41Y]|uniref:hypothetical protein n=1 Tax=Gordonia sp. NB41Y TaxID=875808 RepID=UPI0002BF109C|nr:hypothetical protein [Gordonia sp. NB41Y]WLP92282.1 hypothetical protein Q9K23_08680 [Gordonia sp. NB41Y]